MAKTALLFKSQYQLTLGDNFYGSGVYSIDDLRFQVKTLFKSLFLYNNYISIKSILTSDLYNLAYI